jgi:hypothetical protein
LWVRFPPPASGVIIPACAVLPSLGLGVLWRGLVPGTGSGLFFCLVGKPTLESECVRGNAVRKGRLWPLILLASVALLGGMGLGLWYGWVLDPVEYRNTDVSHLAPVYRDTYVLMVGEAYALDGDLDAARARLALLHLADPANHVADLAEATLARGAPRLDVQALARLAAALGAQRETLAPYLEGGGDAP